MLNTSYADGVDGITLKGGKQNAAQRVAYGNTEARLKRTEFELAELVICLKHHNFIGFLKC